MNPAKTIYLKSLVSVVKEFTKALKQKHTYSLRENWYCLFGILWGVPIPVVTIGIDLYSSGLSLTIPHVFNIVVSHPIQFFFLFHPIFFAVVFGAMGTVRYNKDREIQEFEKSLINKNEELNKINKKLQELGEMKSDFLSMISHELRTPLTTILGYISLLKSKKAGVLTEGQAESVNICEEEAVRLNHLIEELLDLTKIEAGELKIQLEKVDIVPIINKGIQSLQPMGENRGISLINNIPGTVPFILADKERILQVIINLIENAIKFNNTGGKVFIDVINNSEDNTVKLCISDTGAGIEKNKLDKIFDKFYQVASLYDRRHGGCGLGLAISKSIVDLHKGSIWAESEIGTGSKFFIKLIKYNNP